MLLLEERQSSAEGRGRHSGPGGGDDCASKGLTVGPKTNP